MSNDDLANIATTLTADGKGILAADAVMRGGLVYLLHRKANADRRATNQRGEQPGGRRVIPTNEELMIARHTRRVLECE